MKGVTISAAILYAIFLQVAYVLVIAPDFSYAGYTTRPLSFLMLATATFLAACPSTWLPLQLSRPSQLMYWILYIVAYVPSVLIPFYTLRMRPSGVLAYALALLVAFALFALIYKLPTIRISHLHLNPTFFWIAVASLTILAIGVVVATFGVPKGLPSLTSIYEVRGDYVEGLIVGGRFVGFSVTWLVNVVGPLFIALGLFGRRWLVLGLGLLLELGIFATTGFKTALLAPVALLVFYLIVRFGAQAFSAILSLSVLVLIPATLLLDALFEKLFLVSWLVRRFLITPGLASGRFFEFFSENDFALLGHSVLGPFSDARYALTPPYLVGMAYEGRMFSANANIWADGFANFGFLGMLMVTLLAAGVAYLLDSFSQGRSAKQKNVIALLLVLPAITFSNSAVLTSLMTHGVLVIILLVFAWPSDLSPSWRRRRFSLKRFMFSSGPAAAIEDKA